MTEVGTVYGEALYFLAREEGLSEDILSQLKVLDSCFTREPGFIRLLSSPNLPKTDRCQILEDAFRGKLQPYVLNFLKILTGKGYMRHFHNCAEAYREKYNQDNGILPVTAVTVCPMTQAQIRKLTEKLHAATGKQIALVNRLDPNVLGGIRLDYDGNRLDATVSHRLDAIRKLLRATVL